MSGTIARRCLWLVLWGITLTGTLSIANRPGDWGHSICGAWGCGPPLQALVACHLSWLVVLIPIVTGIRRPLPRTVYCRIAIRALLLASAAAVVITLNELLTWHPQDPIWQRQYFWRRVAFVIMTMVDLPIVEVIVLSATAILCTASIKPSQREDNQSAETSLTYTPK